MLVTCRLNGHERPAAGSSTASGFFVPIPLRRPGRELRMTRDSPPQHGRLRLVRRADPGQADDPIKMRQGDRRLSFRRRSRHGVRPRDNPIVPDDSEFRSEPSRPVRTGLAPVRTVPAGWGDGVTTNPVERGHDPTSDPARSRSRSAGGRASNGGDPGACYRTPARSARFPGERQGDRSGRPA